MSEDAAALSELNQRQPTGDPQGQLDFLQEVIEVVGQIGHPRLKPIKKKLRGAFAALGRGVEEGKTRDALAVDLAADLDALRDQTYTLLSTVTLQLQTTLKRKHKSMSPNDHEQAQRLLKGLGMFSGALRQMMAAKKSGSAEGRKLAVDKMNNAHAAMRDETGGQEPKASG